MTTWHTALTLSGMPIPSGAHRGIEESHKELQEGEVYLTWNGIPKIRGPVGERHRHVHEIELSCDSRWGPAIQDLRIGQALVLHSIRWEAFVIPAGQTSVTLRRFPVPCDPVPRKPHGRQVLGHAGTSSTLVPVAVAGRVVSIAAPLPHDVIGQYRAIRPVWLLKITPGSTKETEGKQSWGLTLIDRVVPEGWQP